jgi:hypothetical protein
MKDIQSVTSNVFISRILEVGQNTYCVLLKMAWQQTQRGRRLWMLEA